MDKESSLLSCTPKEMFERSCKLYDLLFEVFSHRKGSTFKPAGLFSWNKTKFSKSSLKRNCILLGCCLQYRVLSSRCIYANELTLSAIKCYVDELIPNEPTTIKEHKQNELWLSLSIFDLIDSGLRPTHVGLPMLPKEGSFTDNLFYRYSVWIIENSLEVPAPLFDAIFVFEVCDSIISWFIAAQNALSLRNYSGIS